MVTAWDNKGDIVIDNDVWIGYEAVIMAGVHIGNGAIIAARAVVTKGVPPYTIVGGVPARPIRKRFDEDTIRKLETLKWWDWSAEKIRRCLPYIVNGDVNNLFDGREYRELVQFPDGVADQATASARQASGGR